MRAIIDACQRGRIDAEVSIVISNNADAPALATARDNHIATAHLSSRTHPQPEKLDRAMLQTLQQANVDLVVLAGFMKKIGPETLAIFHGRIINIHPSLLPKFGGQGMFGQNVHQAVLDSGEKETGVTVHMVDKEYDEGAILAQESVAVLDNDDAKSLSERVLKLEHQIYTETIQKIIDGSIILPQ